MIGWEVMVVVCPLLSEREDPSPSVSFFGPEGLRSDPPTKGVRLLESDGTFYRSGDRDRSKVPLHQ